MRWKQVVGERLARETRPESLEDGELVVRVSSAPWAVQVGFRKDRLAASANEALGGALVTSVRVVVGPLGR